MDFQEDRQFGKECRRHNQIIHFDNDTKATYLNVVRIWQDTLVHIVLENGREFLINPRRVLSTEIEWLESPKQSKK